MVVVVTAESVLLVLLVVLVAGLLRSHADILRALHDLGVRIGDPASPDETAGIGVAPVGLADPVRADPVRADRARVGAGGDGRPGAFQPAGAGRPAADLAGVTPGGEAVAVGVSAQETVLAFLSSGCATCAGFWASLGSGAHRGLAPARVVVVTRDPAEESEAALARLAPPDVTVVMSSQAWDRYEVPGSPYFVHVADGAVRGEGTASRWDQLVSLYGQAGADRRAGTVPGAVPPGASGAVPSGASGAVPTGASGAVPSGASGAEREARADRELLAAGIEPGHPSLYPPVARDA